MAASQKQRQTRALANTSLTPKQKTVRLTEEDRLDLRDALRALKRAKREGVYLFADIVRELNGGAPAKLQPYPLESPAAPRFAASGCSPAPDATRKTPKLF
jgi:hypothetical protein